MPENKKAALQLSIGTIVIIVIAMAMLILGIVLVQQIFSVAKYNVNTIDQKVRNEISKLFTEDKKIVVYLANQKAEIKQGEDWGIAFAIKNLETGTAEASRFSYNIFVSDPDLRKNCGISEREAEDWMVTGRSDSVNLPPGDVYFGIVRFSIPLGAPMCTARFHIEVKKDAEIYKTEFFDVVVKSK